MTEMQRANFFEGNISEGREQITVFNIPFEVLCGLATTILGHKCVPVTSHIPCHARLDYGGEKLPCIGSSKYSRPFGIFKDATNHCSSGQKHPTEQYPKRI